MPENRIPPLPEGASTPPLLGRRILLAVEDAERLKRILAGHELTLAASVDQAKAELQKREFALIVLGVHFDESRMFELLRFVRTYRTNQLTPVVRMLTSASRLSDVANVLIMPAIHSASISTKLLAEIGGVTMLGPLLVGLDKPVQIAPLNAKMSDIFNMAVLAAYDISR